MTGGRKSPNYKTEILLRIVSRIQPASAAEWKRVAVDYKIDSHEVEERDGVDIKRHFIEKMCNRNKKVTGEASPKNALVKEAQRLYGLILKKEGAVDYGGSGSGSSDESDSSADDDYEDESNDYEDPAPAFAASSEAFAATSSVTAAAAATPPEAATGPVLAPSIPLASSSRKRKADDGIKTKNSPSSKRISFKISKVARLIPVIWKKDISSAFRYK